LDYVTNTFKGKTSTSFKNYSFYIKNRLINHEFKLNCSYKIPIGEDKKDKKVKKALLLEIFDKKKQYCLKFELKENKQHPDYKNFRGFKKSYIHNINKNVCGIKRSKYLLSLSGSYILNLVDKINKIFKVEESELSDDSRLELKDENGKVVSRALLKIIKLYEYNKTWYQKEGGYLPINHLKLSQYSKDAGKLKLKDLYGFYNDKDLRTYGLDKNQKFHNEKFVEEEDIKEVYRILKKEKLDENSNLKSVAIAFKSKKITSSEKLKLWFKVFSLDKRKKISQSKNPEYKLIQAYLKLLEHHFQIKHTKMY
ncbi:uncharacterized protein METZ01_LOCUS343887, partial [marine metagenome]